MATPPLPDRPCVRVRLSGINETQNTWGNRFYLRYSGSAPSGANCVTLATDIGSAWNTNLASIIHHATTLTEVDVLDITTPTGASAAVAVSYTGSENSGATVPEQVAMNVEFGVAIRYRGGKPRFYLPPPTAGKYNNANSWLPAFLTTVNTQVAAFFAAIEALSVGSMGTLTHTLVSYYEGYEPRTTGGGQTTFKPKYRTPNALTFDVTGYSAKSEFGSQRRRRSSTTQ